MALIEWHEHIRHFFGVEADGFPTGSLGPGSTVRHVDTGHKYEYNGVSWIPVPNHLLSYVWAGAGAGGAPSATNLPDFTVGCDSGGVAAGLTYHVIDGSWVATGGTVANLYGG